MTAGAAPAAHRFHERLQKRRRAVTACDRVSKNGSLSRLRLREVPEIVAAPILRRTFARFD